LPSPKFHTTLVGVAVAVADTAPAEAVALIVFQSPDPIHNHVGTPTNCSAPSGGAISMVGEVRPSFDTAC
jgi:hypothetical protein